MAKSHLISIFFLCCIIINLLPAISADCTCDHDHDDDQQSDNTTNKSSSRAALHYKLAAMASILAASAAGVCIPVAGKRVPALSPDRGPFFVVKAFAAGVILATGFIHVLPDAFESLTSPCLNGTAFADFPFTGFVAMLAAIGTLMVDTYATAYWRRRAKIEGTEGALPMHSHAHGAVSTVSNSSEDDEVLLRHRVISQVLEMGIAIHSVIIGIALGASPSPNLIRPLIVALTFHQFFEGIGLGGCITQAKFKSLAVTLMAIGFSITTPLGIGIGIGISNIYSETSPTALIVQGVFNAASAGILIYMALVDLLAADFMSAKLQNNGKLRVGANASLLVGAGCMSLLAIWA